MSGFSRCYGPLADLLYGIPPRLSRALRRDAKPAPVVETPTTPTSTERVRKQQRQCALCEMWMPRTNFRLDPSGIGLSPFCRRCEDAMTDESIAALLARHSS